MEKVKKERTSDHYSENGEGSEGVMTPEPIPHLFVLMPYHPPQFQAMSQEEYIANEMKKMAESQKICQENMQRYSELWNK